tara:strand:+ start:134 stop:592 length:459 start_codon:yes stop_codon:yes gene_type:complete
MKNISKNISYKESTRSRTAVKKGIDNTPSMIKLKAMRLVAEKVFQPVREWYGKPISINSFFRCVELNTVIGGVIYSQHVNGEAIDIDTDEDNAKLFHYILDNLEFDKLIWEYGDDLAPAWIHLSYREVGNRQESYRIYRDEHGIKRTVKFMD